MSEKHIGNLNAGKWQPEHDAMLMQRREHGFSSAQIGVILNLEFHTDYTRNAVIGRCHRLGLTKKPPGPQEPKGPRMRVRATPFREPMPLPAGNQSLRCAPVAPLNLSLLELEDAITQCRWPYRDLNFIFCGLPVLDGCSYCGLHARLSVRGGAA
jgi:hypothetical protein